MEYSSEFYDSLKKPSITPSKQVFRNVWTVLYILLAVSFFIILFSPNSIYKVLGLALFVVQLILNLNWGIVFFLYKKIQTALWICIALAITVYCMTFLFLKVSILAGLLQLPYCIWLVLAIYLNYFIVRENPEI